MNILLAALAMAAFGELVGWLLARFFVPGLWNRHRESIARFVGALSARELASGEVLRKRLGSARTKEELGKGIREKLRPIFEGPLGNLLAAGPVDESLPARLATRSVERLIESPELAKALDAAFAEALAIVKDIPLSVVFPQGKVRELTASFLSARSLQEFAERMRRWIETPREVPPISPPGPGETGALALRRETEGEREVLFAGLVSAASLSPLVGLFIDALYDAAVPVVEAFLNDIDTRDTIEKSAKEMVRRAMTRLSVMQRLIAGAANYERGIAESMPETIEDLVSMVSSLLRSPSMREKARDAALESWESGLGGGSGSGARGRQDLGILARIGLSLSRDALWRAISAVLGRLVEDGPAVADRIEALAAAGKNATISSLLGGLGLGAEDVAALGRLEISSLLASESPAGTALLRARETFFASFSTAIASRSLADILDLDEADEREISSWLADSSLAILGDEADGIAAGLGIEDLIIEKVSSIDNSEARRIFEPALKTLSRFLALTLATIGFLGGLAGALFVKMLGG